MPTYDYLCEACGQVFELSHGINEPSPETCSCGERGTLRRLISAGGGLIFKGSGFYVTDYKRNGSSSAGKTADRGAKESTSSPCEASGSCPCAASS